MKVKLSTIYASPHLTAQPGSVIDVGDEEGRQLIEGRYGIEIPETAAEAPATPETAPAETAEAPAAPETAARKPASRRVRG